MSNTYPSITSATFSPSLSPVTDYSFFPLFSPLFPSLCVTVFLNISIEDMDMYYLYKQENEWGFLFLVEVPKNRKQSCFLVLLTLILDRHTQDRQTQMVHIFSVLF